VVEVRKATKKIATIVSSVLRTRCNQAIPRFMCGRPNATNSTESYKEATGRAISRCLGPVSWMVSMDFFSKIGMAKTMSELDEWFERLREHGRELGVEIEPLTVCERLCLEHENHWMARS